MTTPFPPGMGGWGRAIEREIAALKRRLSNQSSGSTDRPVLVATDPSVIRSPRGTVSSSWKPVATTDSLSVRVVTNSGLIRYTLSAMVSATRIENLFASADSSMAVTLTEPTNALTISMPERDSLRHSFRFGANEPGSYRADSMSTTGVLRLEPGAYTLYTGYSYQHTTDNIAVAWSDRVLIAEAI